MPRLVNYGTGDLVDRLTILALKILHYGESGKDIGYLVQERNTLLGQLRGKTLNGAWFEHTLDLATVNAALWSATDQMRGYLAMKDPDLRELANAGALGMDIMKLNDRRNRLTEAINKLTGEHLGPEKG